MNQPSSLTTKRKPVKHQQHIERLRFTDWFPPTRARQRRAWLSSSKL